MHIQTLNISGGDPHCPCGMIKQLLLCIINVVCMVQDTLLLIRHVTWGWGAGLHAARVS